MTYRLQGVFTAIADPHRRAMLDYLAAGELSAGELAAKFDISRPAVANHLKILEDNRLVRITRRGRRRMHSLDPHGLLEVRDWLNRYAAFWDDRLDTLKALVEAEGKDEATE
ncbi:ArsR/SmtB family transcription factor [Bauldia sp.]|uniref:ArsR/SmtB family transcription factor n=1 Tax=Bauldia sp. TaxID=2575872 RepID=UPI003BA9B6B7